MFLNFNMYLNISETTQVFAWNLKAIWHITSNICRSSFITLYCILTKLCPFLSLLIYLQSILDNMSGPLYNFYTNGRIFFKLESMFTPTGQCAEPILPLYQLCQGHWRGYELHSTIVLVSDGPTNGLLKRQSHWIMFTSAISLSHCNASDLRSFSK